MANTSGLNRIIQVIPANSQYAAIERDAAVTNLTAMGITNWQHYRYLDTSPLRIWGYYNLGTLLSPSGAVTIATVTCTGVTHPPSGSNITANPDPGVGSIVWASLGYPFALVTSGDADVSGQVPPQNPGFYVWNIPGSSTNAAADFTAANTLLAAAMPSNVTQNYFKYVDSVSGAWQVYCLFVATGVTVTDASVPNHTTANGNTLYAVTCSGTPNPPTGSPAPARSLPAFVESFATITARLSFGPVR